MDHQLKSDQKVTIFIKPKASQELTNLIPTLVNWLVKRGKTPQFLDLEQERVQNFLTPKDREAIVFIPLSKLKTHSDLIITLGGDGTLIGTCRKLKSGDIPIFGVNLGTLGFITEFTKNEFFDSLTNYFSGKLKTFRLTLFSVKVLSGAKTTFKELFLNDAVITKSEISRMVRITIEDGQELVYDLDGDGIIVSSPIGSTAYSLAAGGPIIHSTVKTLILSPICPHSLTHRPMCVPDTSKILIKPRKGESNLTLTLDGQLAHTIGPKDKIVIQKENKIFITLVKNPNKTYYHTLREKFSHGKKLNL
jgi:NAD+ kinase